MCGEVGEVGLGGMMGVRDIGWVLVFGGDGRVGII